MPDLSGILHTFSIHKTENDAVISCAYLLSEYYATLPLCEEFLVTIMLHYLCLHRR